MKLKRNTTFGKLTLGFVLLGMLPLMVIGIIFFARYSDKISGVMASNYTQITGYFARNVTDMIEEVDAIMGELYDYETEKGSLNQIIKDEQMNESEKNLYMITMLRDFMSKSDYISSERFVDRDGNIYSLFYDQNKTMRNNTDSYLQEMRPEEDQIHALEILATAEESQFCINTDDYIFTLVRNYMDVSSVEKINSEVLGTFFVDINVQQLDRLAEEIQIEQGELYVYRKKDPHYIYSKNTNDYLNGADPLAEYSEALKEQRGNSRINGHWIFYEQIGNTEAYAILLLDESEVLAGLFQSRTMVILILCFVAFVLMGLYMFFSRRMSQPVAELKRAMEEVQRGNLSVQVKVDTKDEMEYISDGFNKMVQDLQTYIDQVYVAQICQKEAELNALKMQIQPHYLYNTLDVIRMTALDHDDEETAELLESLAYQLRYVLGEQNEKAQIREEIKMLQEYFVIMKARYQGRISMTVSVSDEDASLLVPKMLFQPIIENAIRHGLRQKKGKGTVAIQVERQGDELQVVIMDDGVGMSEERVQKMQEALDNPKAGQADKSGWLSVGMKNVYDRIKLNCGKQYGYVIHSVEGMGTIVTFHLPVWKEGDENVESSNGR